MHPCTEFGVASSKFTFTGGPHVKKSFPPLARAACAPLERQPQKHSSWGGTRVTCEFGIGGSLRSTCRCVRIFLQAFTRQHVPRATCHRWTPDRYHRRSGVSGHRSVPLPSRSDQPFGRYSRKCLDTHTYIHTYRQTRSGQLFFGGGKFSRRRVIMTRYHDEDA